MNALVKEVSATIPAAEVAFFRGLIGSVLILIIMKRTQVSFSRRGIPMLLLRGAMGGMYMLAFFYALSRMPIADASMLAQTSPLFVVLLSAIFLKEPLGGRTKWFLLVIAAGAAVIVNPLTFAAFSWAALAGLAGAIFAAAASVSIRYLSKSHPSYEIVFYFVATSTVVALPFTWNSFVVPGAREWGYLIVIGVVSLLGQLFLTKAFTHEKAVVVQMVSYSGLLMNVLLGFVFWQEAPGWIAAMGGSLIVVGCIGLSAGKKDR